VAEGQPNATAPAQQAGGVVWNVSSAYKSGMVTSWNKFWWVWPLSLLTMRGWTV
jgi:hypothetical protein